MRTFKHRSLFRATPPMPTLAATAAGCLVAVLTLPGCGTTGASAPEPEDVPHRDPAAGDAVPTASDAAAEAAEAAEVPILRRTAAANGAPVLYSLVLIDEAGELPGPVADALRPDFETESVVFLGMGEQPGPGYAAEITGVRRAGDELTVAAEMQRPEEATPGERTTPWSAVVIPRQDGVSPTLLSDFH